jgi:large subunit ribosomal protein L39e
MIFFFAKLQSQKSFRTKVKLAKAQKQNRPIPQWIRLRTGNTIRYVVSLRREMSSQQQSADIACDKQLQRQETSLAQDPPRHLNGSLVLSQHRPAIIFLLFFSSTAFEHGI